MRSIFLIGLIFIFLSCKKEADSQPKNPFLEEEELNPGGENGTTNDASFNAFGQEVNGLSSQEKADFVVGNSFFKLNWVPAPASTADRDGLGPIFSSASCSGCHVKDGRGLPPELKVGESGSGLLIRASLASGLPHPIFGGQLQAKGIVGVTPDPEVSVSWINQNFTFPDGESVVMRKPSFQLDNSTYGLTNDLSISPRLAPQIIGMGLLEAIPEVDLLKNEDIGDQNQDGISGKANRVFNRKMGQTVIGRFGWKAGQPSVLQQTAGAFNGDMGITSSLFPSEDFTETQKQLFPGLINGGNPEISDILLNRVTLYTAALAVPARKNATSAAILDGKKVFSELGCAQCHVPRWKTGNSPISSLTGQVIFPYTDLLLHNMGPELADNRPEAMADGQEWRTPPLWGISKIETVNNKRFLLHDGRAKTISEAILWHGGEGAKSKERFQNLTQGQRKLLLDFVSSL
jgi:CxxC motif-containing protein (DUF1111 family)